MNVLGHSTNSQAIPSHFLASDTSFMYIWLTSMRHSIFHLYSSLDSYLNSFLIISLAEILNMIWMYGYLLVFIRVLAILVFSPLFLYLLKGPVNATTGVCEAHLHQAYKPCVIGASQTP